MTPSALASRAATRVLTGGILVWQWVFRPVMGPNCRFYPSCSDYGMQAVRLHGPLRGSALAICRILRCNPWHPGGHDPVPMPQGAPCSCSVSKH